MQITNLLCSFGERSPLDLSDYLTQTYVDLFINSCRYSGQSNLDILACLELIV